MIIVEGPDGSGKSTLIKQLEKRLNVKAAHFGGPPAGMQEIGERVTKSLNATLLDRWSPISEQVYGIIRETPLSIDILDTYIRNNDIFVIYCRPPKELLRTNKDRCLKVEKSHKSKTHIAMVSSNFEKVIALYDNVVSKMIGNRIKVREYDYSEKNAFENLILNMKEREII